MANKDFLSQFSDNNKPDSFKEEERIKITKEPKKINIKLIVIILASLLLIAGVVLFFIFRPTIEVKNFVGENVNDVKAWIKQNEIATQGVIFKEEYNFDYDEGHVIYQSINEGEKIRKNAKIDFIVSLGADPDEKIKVPDILTMTKDEIQKWIDDNKLTKTKIMNSFDDEKAVGEVISFEFKNCDEDTFTRSSTLNISVSKGPQPAGVVTVGDFENKHYSEVETWAKSNKVTLNKVTSYSDKVEKDLVISQSIAAKKEMKQGETLTITVSLGKAVYASNLIGMTYTDASTWASKNGVTLYSTSRYSNTSEGKVIDQSIDEGKIITDGIEVIVSLGKPDLSSAKDLDSLKDLISKCNEDGANLKLGKVTYENSDDVAVDGLIESYTTVNVGSEIKPRISLGKNIWLLDSYSDADGNTYDWLSAQSGDEEYARTICELAGVNYKVIYQASDVTLAHNVISIVRAQDADVVGGAYISEAEQVIVTISSEYIGE